MKKNAPPPPPSKENSPEEAPRKENSPEHAIPCPAHEPSTDAPTMPRPTEPVPMASLVHAANPSQPIVLEEGEIPQSALQTYPSRVETHDFIPPSAHQPSVEENPQRSPVANKDSVLDKVCDPSPQRFSIHTMKKTPIVGPSVVRSVSTHHSDSVIYGDEVISIEDELIYPYPREHCRYSLSALVQRGTFQSEHTSSILSRESIQ